MARQVEDRVVQMQFDNAKFEQNVKTSISTLDKLKNALNLGKSSASIEGFTATTTKASSNTLAFANAMEVMRRKMPFTEILRITALMKAFNASINAVNRSIRALTIDQLTAGMSKYEEKTASVQTLVNSTGKSVDDINGYLKQLMWFSDETSYSFTNMTSALSQMTSSGGDIEKLVPMITGIANATAYAGKGATEFSRAIYNLGQSYSQGYLSLLDWKSVQGAGVNSKQLVEELIKAGEELGKIQKGTITLGTFTDSLKDKWADTEVMEKAFGKFSELSQAAYKAVAAGEYSTAAEAIEALSDNFDELSQRAFKSAQEAKSFTEAMNATKDAVSSGWMTTFEIIFGTYDEAKKLWTSLANTLWEVFASGAESRNDLLKGALSSGWKQLMEEGIPVSSDYQKFIKQMAILQGTFANMDEADEFIEKAGGWEESLAQGWVSTEMLQKATLSYAKTLNELTPEQLKSKKYTKEQVDEMMKLADAMYSGEISAEEFAKRMGEMSGRMKLFSGLGNIFNFLRDLITPLLNGFGELFNFVTSDNLKSGIDKFYEWTQSLKVSEQTSKALRAIGSGLASVFRTIGSAVSFVVKGFLKLVGYMQPVFDGFVAVGGAIGEFVGSLFDGIDAGGIFTEVFRQIGNAIRTASSFIGGGLTNFSKWIKDSIGPAKDWLSYAGEQISNGVNWVIGSFIGLKDGLTNIASGLKKPAAAMKGPLSYITETVSNFVNELKSLEGLQRAVSILANLSMFTMFYVFAKKIRELTTAIGSIASEFAKAMHKLGSMFTSIGTYFKAKAFSETAKGFKTIVISMAILLGAMAALYIIFAKMPDQQAFDNMIKASTRMMLGVGALILAIAIIDARSSAVGNVSKPLDLVNELLPSFKKMATIFKIGSVIAMFATAAIGVMAIAKSLQYFAEGIEALGKIDTKVMQQGLNAVMSLMGVITAMIFAMSRTGFGAIVIGPALLGLTVVVAGLMLLAKVFMNLPAETIGSIITGMGVFTAMIAGLGLAMRAFFSSNASPKQILAIAGALFVIGAAMVQFSLAVMSFKLAGVGIGDVVLALIPLAAAIGTLIGLTFLFDKFAKTVPTVVPTLLAFSGAIALMGIGIASLSLGLTVLGGTIDIIGPGLLKLARYVGLGIVEVVKVIGESAPVIVDAVGKVITAIIQGIITYVPQIEAIIGDQTQMVLEFAAAAIIAGAIAAFTGLPITLVAILAGAIFLARKDIEKFMMDNALLIAAAATVAIGVVIASIQAGVTAGIIKLRLGIVAVIFASSIWIKDEVTKATGSAAAGIIAAIGTALAGIYAAVTFGLLPGKAAVLSAIKSFFLLLHTAIGSYLIDLGRFITSIGPRIAVNIGTIQTAIGAKIIAVGKFISTLGPWLAVKIGTISTAIGAKILAIGKFISTLGPLIAVKLGALSTFIGGKIMWLAGAISAQIQAAWVWITTSAAAGPAIIIAMIALALAGIYFSFKDEIDAFFVKAGQAISEFFGNLVKWISDGITWVVEQITGIGFIKSIGGWLQSFGKDSGQNVAKGFNDGLNGAKSTTESAVRAYGEGIKKTFKNELQINSPSKVFEKFGQYTSEGFIVGLRNNANNVLEAMRTLAANMLQAFANKMGINSPAKATMQQAGYLVEGYYNGIKDNQQPIVNVMNGMATNIINPLRGARDEALRIATQISGAFGNGNMNVSTFIDEKVVQRKLDLQKEIAEKQDEIDKQEAAIRIWDDAPASMVKDLTKLENELKDLQAELININNNKLSATAVASKFQQEVKREQDKIKKQYRQLGAEQKDIDIAMYETLLTVTNKYSNQKLTKDEIRKFAKDMYETQVRNEFKNTAEGLGSIIGDMYGKDILDGPIGEVLKNAMPDWSSTVDSYQNLLSDYNIKGIGNDIGEDIGGGIGSGIDNSLKAYQLYKPNAWTKFVDEVGVQMANTTKKLAMDATQSKTSLDKIAKVINFSADELETYISAAKEFNDITIEEQLVMWSNLIARTREGTEENYKAQRGYYAALNAVEDDYLQKSLNRIQAQRDARQISWKQQVDALKSLRDEYAKESIVYMELTNKINEAARQQYQVSRNWIDNQSSLITKLFGEQRVLKTNPNLTDDERKTVLANIKSLQQQIYKETKKYYDDRESLVAEYEKNTKDMEREGAQAEEDMLEAAKNKVAEETRIYEDALKARANALYSAFGMFDRAGDIADIDGEYLISNLQTQLDAIGSYNLDLTSLTARVNNDDFIKEIQNMGINAAAEVKSLNKMTDEELSKYVELWKQKHDMVNSQAEFDLRDARDSMNKEISRINSEANQLITGPDGIRETYAKELAQLKTDHEKDLQDLRKTWMVNMGLMNEEVDDNVSAMVNNIINQYGEVHKWSEESGHLLEKTTTDIINTIDTFSKAYDAINQKLQESILQTQGFAKTSGFWTTGLTTSIVNGTPKVISAAVNMVNRTLEATKEASDTHSPSRAFMKIAEYWIQGLVNGVSANAPSIFNSMKEMVSTVLDNVSGLDEMVLYPVIRPIVEDTMEPIIDTNPVITPTYDLQALGVPDLTRLMMFNRSLPVNPQLAGISSNTQQLQNLQGTTNVTSDQIVNSVLSLKGDISILAAAMRNLQIVLDTGELVGGITADVDSSLGKLAFYNERGM